MRGVNETCILSITLPLPASKNKIYGKAVRDRRVVVYTPPAVRKLRGDIHLLVTEALIKSGYNPTLFVEPFDIVLECRWFHHRKGVDIINFHDELADSMKRALGYDDDRFLIRDLSRKQDKENPRVEVSIFIKDTRL